MTRAALPNYKGPAIKLPARDMEANRHYICHLFSVVYDLCSVVLVRHLYIYLVLMPRTIDSNCLSIFMKL